jgi:hypothetical protein
LTPRPDSGIIPENQESSGVKVSQVQSIVSLHGGATVKRAEAIATELRAVGLLPKGGRGPHAPVCPPLYAGYYLLAVAGAERIADAVENAMDLGGTVNAEHRFLSHILDEAICSPEKAYAICCIRVMAHIPMAEVVYRDADGPGATDRFFAEEVWKRPDFKPFSQAQGFVGRIGHIGGGVLTQLAFYQQDGDETGEMVG